MIHVFVIAPHALLGEGVERLLGQRADMVAVGRAASVASAMEPLAKLRPDVVILESECAQCRLTSDVSHILQEGLAAKVITLSLQNNTMCIYSGERKEVRGIEDLFEAMGTAQMPAADAPPGS